MWNQLKQLIFLFLIMGLTLTFVSCQLNSQKMDPIIICPPPVVRINQLPSAFPPLSQDEQHQEWAKELLL